MYKITHHVRGNPLKHFTSAPPIFSHSLEKPWWNQSFSILFKRNKRDRLQNDLTFIILASLKSLQLRIQRSQINNVSSSDPHSDEFGYNEEHIINGQQSWISHTLLHYDETVSVDE